MSERCEQTDKPSISTPIHGFSKPLCNERGEREGRRRGSVTQLAVQNGGKGTEERREEKKDCDTIGRSEWRKKKRRRPMEGKKGGKEERKNMGRKEGK